MSNKRQVGFSRKGSHRGGGNATDLKHELYFASTDGAGVAFCCFFPASGTRNMVWQCWHLTSLPRTSSETVNSRRHRRLGQSSWTGIYGLPSIIGPLANKLEIKRRSTPFRAGCSPFVEALGTTGELGESKVGSQAAQARAEGASAHPRREKPDHADRADKVDRQCRSASSSPRGKSASKPRPA